MSLSEIMQAKRADLLEAMVQSSNPEQGTPTEDVRQFLEGFVTVAIASADGNDGPRDEYLQAVIPPLKQGGMPLGTVMDGMLRVATSMAAVLGREHLVWVAAFNARYTVDLIEIWEKS